MVVPDSAHVWEYEWFCFLSILSHRRPAIWCLQSFFPLFRNKSWYRSESNIGQEISSREKTDVLPLMEYSGVIWDSVLQHRWGGCRLNTFSCDTEPVYFRWWKACVWTKLMAVRIHNAETDHLEGTSAPALPGLDKIIDCLFQNISRGSSPDNCMILVGHKHKNGLHCHKICDICGK